MEESYGRKIYADVSLKYPASKFFSLENPTQIIFIFNLDTESYVNI